MYQPVGGGSGMLGHPGTVRNSGQGVGDKPTLNTADSSSDEDSSDEFCEFDDDDDDDDDDEDSDDDGDDGGDDEQNFHAETTGAPLHSYAHPNLVYVPNLVFVPPVQQTIASSNPAPNSGANQYQRPSGYPASSVFAARYSVPSVPPSNLGLLPQPVVLDNPTTTNVALPGYVHDPPTTTNGTTNSKPPNREKKKTGKGKKRRSRRTVFFRAELFGQKRPCGVMEAFEVAKLAGPTKRQKKAMSRAERKEITWRCQLCGAVFQWERQLKGHLRARRHKKSAVIVDKPTFEKWLAGVRGGKKKKKKKGKKKGKKGKGEEKDKANGVGKGKAKKVPVPAPTAADVTGPPVGMCDNLVEGLAGLELGDPELGAGNEKPSELGTLTAQVVN